MLPPHWDPPLFSGQSGQSSVLYYAQMPVTYQWPRGLLPRISHMVFAPLRSENGYRIAHVQVWNRYGFEGTTGVYECICRFISKWTRKNWLICEFIRGFCWRSNLSYHDIRSFYIRSENAMDSKAGTRITSVPTAAQCWSPTKDFDGLSNSSFEHVLLSREDRRGGHIQGVAGNG